MTDDKQYDMTAEEWKVARRDAATLNKTQRVAKLLSHLRRHADTGMPEQKLCFAVIEHAVRDTYLPSRRRPVPRFFSDGNIDGYAESCGMDPTWIKRQVRLACPW